MSGQPPPSHSPGTREGQRKPLIAVMGITGVGKSTFIKAATGLNIKVGHDLYSCTRDVTEFDFDLNGTLVTLVDTPGFNDSSLPDAEILRKIAKWLADVALEDRRLSGILYLQNIQDNRIFGSSLKNLLMFRQLCGENCYENVVLTTNHWSSPPTAQELRNESGYLNDKELWGRMLERKSSTARFDGERKTALSILESLIPKVPRKLQVQEEMVDKGLKLDETMAGKVVNKELEELKAQTAKEKQELEHQLRSEHDKDIKELIERQQKENKETEERIKEQQRVLSAEMKLGLENQLRELKLQQQPQPVQAAPTTARAPSAGDLFEAYGNDDKSRFYQLLANGVDPNSKDSSDVTILERAAIEGETAWVKILLQFGANINYRCPETGRTPLHDAVVSAKEDTAIAILSDPKCNVNVQDRDGKTPLHKACEDPALPSTIEALVAAGANLAIRDKNNRTPLHLAAKGGALTCVKFLVRKGANVHVKDNGNSTPRKLAHVRGHGNTAAFLKSKE